MNCKKIVELFGKTRAILKRSYKIMIVAVIALVVPVVLRFKLKVSYEAIIVLIALGLSIYSIFRDRKNKQLEMLHHSVASIKTLNRTIAETISDKEKQKEAFLTELKNEYEFLSFLANQKQVEAKDVYTLEGEFLTKLVKKAEIKRKDYPEIYILLDRWKKEGKSKKEDSEQ